MISVLLPTMGRPEMAAECVKSLFLTTEGHELSLCLVVDGEDRNDTLFAIGHVLAGVERGPIDYDLRLAGQEQPRGCSASWNTALAMAEGDPIVFAADDLVWGTGWLDAAMAKLHEFDGGWGMVGFNDGHTNGEHLATHYLMSRRFVVEVLGGVVAWPFYEHSYNDLETTLRAQAAGRYKYAEQAHVEHKHWLWGTRSKDATDRSDAKWISDTATFNWRKLHGFPEPEGHEPVIQD